MTVKSLLVMIGIDTSEFESGMKKAHSTTEGFKKVGLSMTAVGGVLTAVFGIATKGAVESEAAQSKLVNALKNVPGVTKAGTDALLAYAGQLQMTTGVEEEEILSAMSLLATMGLNEGQIAALTPRVLDMATAHAKATGEEISLDNAAMSLGRAVTGNASALSRQGVVMSEETKRTGDFNSILKDLDKAFGGAAEASGKTFAGQLKIAKAGVGEIFESIGGQLLPILTPLITKVVEVVKNVMAWADSHQALLKIIVPVVAGIGAILTVLGPIVMILPKIISGFEFLGKAMITLATNPIAILIAAGVACVAVLLKMKAAIDDADSAADRYDKSNIELSNKLYELVKAGKMTAAQFYEMTDKYNGNSAAMAMAIKQGKEGIPLQEALAAVGKKHAEALEKEGEAANQTGLDVKKFITDLKNLGAAQEEDKTKTVALAQALTDDIKRATLSEVQYQKWALDQEHLARLKAIEDEVKDIKKRDELKLLAKKAYDAKFAVLLKKSAEEQAIISAGMIAAEIEADKKAEERRLLNLSFRKTITGMINQLTMSELKYKQWALAEEARAEIERVKNDITLTEDEKAKRIALWEEYFRRKGELESEDFKLFVSLTETAKSTIEGLLGTMCANVLDAFQKWGEGTGSLLENIGGAFKSFAQTAMSAMKDMVSSIIAQTIKLIAAKQIEAIAAVVASVFQSIPFPLNLVLAGAAIAAVSLLFSAIHLKEGGVVTGPTYALIGEAGPEVVFPLDKLNSFMGGAGGSRTSVTCNFYGPISSQLDVNRIAAQLGARVEAAMMGGRY